MTKEIGRRQQVAGGNVARETIKALSLGVGEQTNRHDSGLLSKALAAQLMYRIQAATSRTKSAQRIGHNAPCVR
jgi:hypothetical protein